LQPAHDASHRLHRDARDIVERLLLGEIDTGGLGVEFEPPRGRLLGAEPFAQARPKKVKTNSMKSLVDDLGKWITAISFARLVVSIVHDWHIILFSVLDFSRSKPPRLSCPCGRTPN
jgi:hypothetical protein